MILVIDNYDSFTWNLVHALSLASSALGLGHEVRVVRNDALRAHDAAAMSPSCVVLSPGPCGPRDAGVCVDLVRTLAGRTPILGVCLGHQAIAEAFGMPVTRAPTPVHGKACELVHDGRGVFAGLPSPLRAARYHSLHTGADAVERARDASGRWEVSAWTTDRTSDAETRIVMGLRRVWNAPGLAPVEGVQFHPESYLTERGIEMLANFLRMTPGRAGDPRPGATPATIVPSR
ncbi:MAG: aminodeoxychorismate/anthranilate synthase component II [Phycisphaeraceae bacterium]|nr:aminodeoxychorismate/anthranilate synthase component II [Phycisphaeraceae bacterium]